MKRAYSPPSRMPTWSWFVPVNPPADDPAVAPETWVSRRQGTLTLLGLHGRAVAVLLAGVVAGMGASVLISVVVGRGSTAAFETVSAQVALVTVDPRNQLYLAPKLAWDVLRYRPGWRAGLKTALQLFSLPAVVVNGRIISRRNEPLDPDTFCHAIRQALPDQDRTIALRSST